MRLLTHNMLICNKKGVVNGYPLAIKANRLVYEETEFSKEFTASMLAKVEWSALVKVSCTFCDVARLGRINITYHILLVNVLTTSYIDILAIFIIIMCSTQFSSLYFSRPWPI